MLFLGPLSIQISCLRLPLFQTWRSEEGRGSEGGSKGKDRGVPVSLVEGSIFCPRLWGRVGRIEHRLYGRIDVGRARRRSGQLRTESLHVS